MSLSLSSQLGRRQLLLIFLFCGLGCVSCFYLQKFFGMPSFLASAMVGLLGSFLPGFSFYDQKQAIACIYTGSFAAMCSLSIFTKTTDLILLCFLVGFYFRIVSPYFRGFGGKLGSIAFLASVTFVGAKDLF